MKKQIIIAALACVALTGCTSMADYAKALANDQAIVAVRLGTPWGTESLTRIGGTTNAVTVNTDGSVSINGGAK